MKTVERRIEMIEEALNMNPCDEELRAEAELRRRIEEGRQRAGCLETSRAIFREQTPPPGLSLAGHLRWARERWAMLWRTGKIRAAGA